MDQVPMRRDEGAGRIPDGCQIKSIRFYRNDGVAGCFFLEGVSKSRFTLQALKWSIFSKTPH